GEMGVTQANPLVKSLLGLAHMLSPRLHPLLRRSMLLAPHIRQSLARLHQVLRRQSYGAGWAAYLLTDTRRLEGLGAVCALLLAGCAWLNPARGQWHGSLQFRALERHCGHSCRSVQMV